MAKNIELLLVESVENLGLVGEVTDSTDITVRLISNKCFFSHFVISLFLTIFYFFCPPFSQMAG